MEQNKRWMRINDDEQKLNGGCGWGTLTEWMMRDKQKFV